MLLHCKDGFGCDQWINPDFVVRIQANKNNDRARVNLRDGSFLLVAETAGAFAKRVLEALDDATGPAA